MSKSIPLKILLSVELKNVMEEVVKQKLPTLAYFKFMKFANMLQAKTVDIQQIYKKLQEQSPELDPLQDEGFKLLLEEIVEVEELPEVLFEKAELTFSQSQIAQLLVA